MIGGAEILLLLVALIVAVGFIAGLAFLVMYLGRSKKATRMPPPLPPTKDTGKG